MRSNKIVYCILLLFSLSFIIGCNEEKRKVFTYNNSKEILHLKKIFADNPRGFVGEAEAEEYDFDAVLIKTFNMANCKLPNKIANKIKEDGGLLPPKVDEFFYKNNAEFPKKIYRLPGKGVEYIMHMVNVVIPSNNGIPESYRHTDYPLNFDGFILKDFIADKTTNLFYTLDSQGYFNAAIAVHGSFSIFSNLQADAKTNLDQKSTVMIGYATIINPFAQAYFNNFPGTAEIGTEKRLKILNKLLTIENLSDSDIITFMPAINCLFATKDSESNLNGKVDIGAEVSTPIVNGNTSSGLSLTKNIKFQVFDTYYVKDNFYKNRDRFTVKNLRSKILELQNSLNQHTDQEDKSKKTQTNYKM